MKILDAKNIRIKASPLFSINDAKALVQRKFLWIEKHILNLQKKVLAEDEFYYLGQLEKIENFIASAQTVDMFYKEKAMEIIPSIVDKYANIMSLFPTGLKFRKNRSRWGSCSYKNVLNLNIYLVKLPLSAIEYIVVHELAHIKHKNHSKRFWDFVELYCPHYKQEEKILKRF